MRVTRQRLRRRAGCGRVFRGRLVATCGACVILLAAAPGAVRAQTDALSLTEVLDLRRRGVSTRQILRNVQEYCIAFAVSDSVERELRAAGADTVLLNGLRQACAVNPASALPPGVLFDDDFRIMSTLGYFRSVDRLCYARPDARGVRLENRRRDVGCAIGYPGHPTDPAGGGVRFELTVAELAGEAGAMAVLGFGKDSTSWDQYTFGVTADRRFELCRTVGGRCRQLLYAKNAPAIHTGNGAENRVAVEVRGRAIVVYVNDDRVGAYVADQDVAGGLSFGVGPRSSAVFSRFRMTRSGTVAGGGH